MHASAILTSFITEFYFIITIVVIRSNLFEKTLPDFIGHWMIADFKRAESLKTLLRPWRPNPNNGTNMTSKGSRQNPVLNAEFTGNANTKQQFPTHIHKEICTQYILFPDN